MKNISLSVWNNPYILHKKVSLKYDSIWKYWILLFESRFIWVFKPWRHLPCSCCSRGFGAFCLISQNTKSLLLFHQAQLYWLQSVSNVEKTFGTVKLFFFAVFCRDVIHDCSLNISIFSSNTQTDQKLTEQRRHKKYSTLCILRPHSIKMN